MQKKLKQDYYNRFKVKACVDQVFNTLTENITSWWTQDFSGSSNTLQAEFTVRFGSTFKTMSVIELIPAKKVVWLCVDSLIDIPELNNNNEWKGTTIIWEINKENLQTKISLTHLGLTPQVACYAICEKGWESFLQSLKAYIETGKGMPFPK